MVKGRSVLTVFLARGKERIGRRFGGVKYRLYAYGFLSSRVDRFANVLREGTGKKVIVSGGVLDERVSHEAGDPYGIWLQVGTGDKVRAKAVKARAKTMKKTVRGTRRR